MLLTKIQVNWPFGSGKQKIYFQDGSHFGFLISNILAIFALQPDASYQVSSRLVFWFRKSEKYIFKIAATAAILDF